MFGILRYLLALMVVQTHLWKAAPWAGNYAVFTFFVLSGYLMTLVLHERYSFDPAGVMRFLANRALRIYPPYWIVLPLAAYAAYHAPHLASAVHRHYALPATDILWLKNILIIGADHPTKSTLVIPAWSLHIELVFYGLMALGLSRNRATVFLWFAAGLAYTVYMAMLHPTEYQFWYYRYFPLQAGSLAFSAGAAVYYLRGRVSLRPGIAFAVTAFAAAFMSGAGVIWSDADALYLQGFYISLSLGFLAVLALAGVDASSLPGPLRSIDRLLGDLSYPIFLCHVPVGALVLWAHGGGVFPNTALFFIISLAVSHLFAWALHAAVERPLGRLRDSVRGNRVDSGEASHPVLND